MPHPAPSVTEVLARVAPALERIFTDFGIPEEVAEEMVEEVCYIYVAKQRTLHNPEKWLLATVIERCRRLKGLEGRDP
jgi:hypothetical protein